MTQAQEGPLFAGELHAVGNEVSALTAGDLTGDGRVDLAVAHAAGHVVAVLPGDGKGGLGAKQNHDVGGGAEAIALASLGGGAGLDVVVALPSQGALGVLLDDGAGGLLPTTFHATGVAAQSVSLGDVDGDGVVDAAAAGGFSGAVAILLGDGAGGLGSATLLSAPGEKLVDASLVDADLDGDLDLLVLAESQSSLRVHAGDGAGGFAPAAVYGSCPYMEELATGDLDGNGYADAAIATHNVFGAQNQVFFGGPGGYVASQASGVPGGGSVVAADVDDDGLLDLAWSDNESIVFDLGDGAGGFAPGEELYLAVGTHSPALADFDADGILDVAAAVGASAVTLVQGLGGGAFAGAERLGLSSYALEAELLDANGDGALDLVMLQSLYTIAGADEVTLALGDGAGGFGTAASIAGLPLHVGGLDSGDLDGDGVLDLVVGRDGVPGGSSVHAFLGDGADGFSVAAVSPPTSGIVQALALADFDLDGVLDVGVGTGFGFAVSGRLAVRYGDGTGAFPTAGPVTVGEYFEIAAGDVDANGAPDLVGADWGGDRLVVVRGDGAGGMLAPTSVPVTYEPRGVAIGDLTGDGLADLAGSGDVGGSGGFYSVHAGDGLGGFAPAPAIPTAARPLALVAGDLDADGDRDLAFATEYGHELWLVPSDGAGGFDAARRFGTGFEPIALATGDVDADGLLDLVVTFGQFPEARVLAGLRPAPAGVVAFGDGTHGCAGQHGLTATRAPHVGDAGLELVSTNAPIASVPGGALGFRVLGGAADFAGSDPLGIGLALHVDPFASFLLIHPTFASDPTGQGESALPIPAQPALAGATVFAQAVWLWTGPCKPTPLGVSSSAGLRLTIQP